MDGVAFAVHRSQELKTAKRKWEYFLISRTG